MGIYRRKRFFRSFFVQQGNQNFPNRDRSVSYTHLPEKHNCTICATEGDHSKLISIKNPETNGPILANILGIGDNIFIDSGEIYTAQLPVDSANLQIEHRSYYNQASTYKRTYNIATIKKTQVGLDYVVQIDDDVYLTNV